MRHFIHGPLTPRQAWEVVAHEIILNNDQVTCAPLLNFLCLACTRNVDADTASPLAQPEFTVPLADTLLTRHRTELVEHKVPGLNRTPILAAGQQISQSLGELVQEQRAAHTDAATQSSPECAQNHRRIFWS
jgi:hypothetical protein